MVTQVYIIVNVASTTEFYWSFSVDFWSSVCSLVPHVKLVRDISATIKSNRIFDILTPITLPFISQIGLCDTSYGTHTNQFI